MSDAHLDQITSLFEQARLLTPPERDGFLEAACEDHDLREEVSSLVAAFDDASAFFDGFADALFADMAPQPGQAADASRDPLDLEGKDIGRYHVESTLGHGGMGVVYKAYDTLLSRSVALKFLSPHLWAEEEARRRFLLEARAASTLEHPNVATIFEIGTAEIGPHHQEGLFIAMAYCEGETLRERIRQRGALPAREALDIALQTGEALHAAHSAGIVHRDIKPANVILTADGTVKLVDFGLAKAASASGFTNPGRPLGTAAYMSPEQARGDSVDARTDIWAVGVLLYEMLCAERPFDRDSELATLYAILHEEPDLSVLESHPGLSQIVERCLETEPGCRYQGAEALLIDLQNVRLGRPSPRSGRATLKHLTSGSRLPKPVLATAGTALLALVVVLAWIFGTAGGNADTLQLEAGAIASDVPGGQASPNPAANELFHEAENLRRLLSPTAERVTGRIRLYQRALQLDPSFAAAWAGLAHGYVARVWGGEDPALWADSARAAVDSALALDPELPAAHAQLGNVLWIAGATTEDQIAAYSRALELDPMEPTAVNNLVTLLAKKGELADAIAIRDRSFHEAPSSRLMNQLTTLNATLGRNDVAEAWLDYAAQRGDSLLSARFSIQLFHQGDAGQARRTLERLAQHAQGIYVDRRRAALALYEHDWPEARRQYRTIFPGIMGASSPIFKGFLSEGLALAYALDRLGDHTDAQLLAQDVIGSTRHQIEAGGDAYSLRHRMAVGHLLLGDKAAALDWLERSVDAGYRDVNQLRHVPVLESLHDEDRFQQVLMRMERLVAEERDRVEANGWGIPPGQTELPAPTS